MSTSTGFQRNYVRYASSHSVPFGSERYVTGLRIGWAKG